ncbi:alpha/beta hydrolase fold-domain-containing protein [Zychaea mexicana]|uniref:alpha/beta hydrolase fold-domain-containing protein n=1 Tax=Zychaea mexicana TaxID=64656 RepID=UPI0022FDD60C|nr:alpha/beta hydrolase fold-domain-containing protein [Zychaea mexicana]KAI9491399.1 alpha/beta hydrolase fold-domain-containing protein [Zychaea mexicana]
MVMTPFTSRLQLEPCFEEALKAEQTPRSEWTPESRRANWTNASLDPQWLKRLPTVIEQELTIPNRAGDASIQLTINRPLGTEDVILPVIVYLHGGGWVIGNSSTHHRPRTELAVAARAAVIFVHYRLAPEYKYPTGLEDCYDAVTWVGTEANARSINVDANTLVVVGDSAGGNLTAAVTLLAKQRGFKGIRAQVLFYPVTDCDFDTESYHRFANYDPGRELMQWFFDHYVPDNKEREKTTVSPLKATTKDLQGLPPALVVTCEADPLLDEGEAYARKLLAAGVDTTALRILGFGHGFLDMCFYDSSAAQAGIDQAVAMLRRIWKE